MTHAAHNVVVGHHRWYTNAASPAALAAEDTNITLTQALMQNGAVYLYLQLVENGGVAGSGTLDIEYTTDGTNWEYISNGDTADQEQYLSFGQGDGAKTDSSTISPTVLTGSNEAGIYNNTELQTQSIGANAIHEVAILIKFRWPPPDVAFTLRILYGGAVLTYDTGRSAPAFTASNRATRGDMTVASMDRWAIAGDQGYQFRYHKPLFKAADGRGWAFTVNMASADQAKIWYGYKNVGDTPSLWNLSFKTLDTAMDLRINEWSAWVQTISGNSVVMVGLFTNDPTIDYLRGQISGTTITWDSQAQIASSQNNRYASVTADDGNFWWIVSPDSVNGVMSARSSSNADAGTSWTPGWGTRHTVADANLTDTDKTEAIGLASGKCLVIWNADFNDTIKAALCDSSTGFGSITTIKSTTADPDRWDVVRSGGYVYLVLQDTSTQNVELYVYSESGDSWTTGTNPSWSGFSSGNTQNDFAVAANGNDIYAIKVTNENAIGSVLLNYKKYTGPGDAGTWDSLPTSISTTTGQRGDGGFLAASMEPIDGAILVAWSHGDDGSGKQTWEVHEIAVSTSTQHNLAPAVAATSTVVVSSSLDVDHKIAPAVAAAGSVIITNSLSVDHKMAGAVAATGTCTIALSVDHALAPAVNSTSDVQAVLSHEHGLAVAVDGLSDVQVTALQSDHVMVAAIAAVSDVQVVLQSTTEHSLAVAIDALSTVTVALSVDHALAPAVDATSDVQAVLSHEHGLAVAVDGLSDVQVALTTSGTNNLAVAIDALSTVTIALSVDHSMVAQSDALSSVAAVLSHEHGLVMAVDGQSDVAAILEVTQGLPTQIDAISTVTFVLTVDHHLATQIAGVSTVTILAESSFIAELIDGQALDYVVIESVGEDQVVTVVTSNTTHVYNVASRHDVVYDAIGGDSEVTTP